jgi:hypothetical protein
MRPVERGHWESHALKCIGSNKSMIGVDDAQKLYEFIRSAKMPKLKPYERQFLSNCLGNKP